MLKQPYNQTYNVVVVVWLTLSLGSVVLAALSWTRLSLLLQTGRKDNAIERNLNDIQKFLLDSETASRGYVITGDKKYLDPLNHAVTNLPACFDALAQFGLGDSNLLQSVSTLNSQAEVCMNWQFKLVAARDRSLWHAADVIGTGQGKVMMDDLRTRIASLITARADKHSVIREEISRQLFRANLISVIAGLLGVGAGIYAWLLSVRAAKQQRRERELIEAKLRMEHINAEKNVFLANMSHEIRTPMNAILGFSELLAGTLPEPRQRQYLQSIQSAAKSLLLLINDILDVSKIEAGVMQLRPEPADLREVGDLIRTLFAESAAKKGLRLECTVAADLPRALLIDRIRLRQILVNLVGNAVKFTDAGAVEIRVTWTRHTDSSHITLNIEVQDTGIGIPAEKLEVIFEPFAQAGLHHDKEIQGSGLGLAIVKRLVELMGGTVAVTSTPGQGSLFRLTFRDVAISARLPNADKNRTIPEVNFNDLRPATLLVVDDNPVNRELIEAMFAGTHHRLIYAGSGEEALTRAREVKPEIVLMDIRMPGITGQETLQHIRKINSLELLPVIAVTASALADMEPGLKERFSGYVRKPFTKRELFDELAEFLPAQKSAGKSALAAPVPPPDSSPVAPELMVRLREMIVNPWPHIRDAVAVNESRAFARELEGLGRRWQCPALVAYAETILHDVENYAVADLELHLGQFAALVNELVEAKQP